MVFGRKKVVREIPEALQDTHEIAEILRARRVVEGFGALWRELYHKLAVEVYLDSNIPREDKAFVVSTIVEGLATVVRRGGLLSIRYGLEKGLSEILRDIAAVLEDKQRVKLEKAAAMLASDKPDLGMESFKNLYEAVKRVGLDMYKEIAADQNIADKRDVWRTGFMAFIDMLSSTGAPALELLVSRYGTVIARAVKVALGSEDYSVEELLGGA